MIFFDGIKFERYPYTQGTLVKTASLSASLSSMRKFEIVTDDTSVAFKSDHYVWVADKRHFEELEVLLCYLKAVKYRFVSVKYLTIEDATLQSIVELAAQWHKECCQPHMVELKVRDSNPAFGEPANAKMYYLPDNGQVIGVRYFYDEIAMYDWHDSAFKYAFDLGIGGECDWVKYDKFLRHCSK